MTGRGKQFWKSERATAYPITIVSKPGPPFQLKGGPRSLHGDDMNMRRFLRRNTVAGPVTWMGSLVLDNQDASGLMYRRNRYYDPHAGRFTQEDPIGLAGGVNAYGFAEGDPVSYGDPYGLSPTEIILRLDASTRRMLNDLRHRSPTFNQWYTNAAKDGTVLIVLRHAENDMERNALWDCPDLMDTSDPVG